MLQNVIFSVGRVHMGWRKLSYVSQARQLQRLKEEDSYCRDQLEHAKFLFYNNGRPLLGRDGSAGRQPLWLDYKQSIRLVPDMEQSCALLGVAADNFPQLALNTGKFRQLVKYPGLWIRIQVRN